MMWNDVISSKQTDSAYKGFLNKFTSLYDKVFEKFVVIGKTKTLKTRQKKRSTFYEHEISYKKYRKLFESIKHSAKSQCYSKMIRHYKDNIKKLGKLRRK